MSTWLQITLLFIDALANIATCVLMVHLYYVRSDRG